MKLLFFLLALLNTLLAMAQQPFAIKPYAITLPRVTTTQQTNPGTVPQQAGNMVYNTDQQAVAVNNGTGWGYLGTGNMEEFRNGLVFNYDAQTNYKFWSVPAGITQIMTEIWSAGAGGSRYVNLGNGTITCKGGGGGGYIRKKISVTPGASLTIQIGNGGKGATANVGNASGGASGIYLNQATGIFAQGGYSNGAGGYGTYIANGLIADRTVDGGQGQDLVISYEPRGGTDYALTLKFGDGGSAFSVQQGGYGGQGTFLNAGTLLYQVEAKYGSFPGGGGGCGYQSGGNGADGLVIIRW